MLKILNIYYIYHIIHKLST